MGNTKTERLKIIRDEILELTSSPLYEYRKEHGYFPVIGEGNHDASIMFVGEAPGRNEAEKGRPFCGAAGKILDALLSHISLERSQVYITNIVKDRPPKNRDPLPEEIATYAPFLDRQIDIIKPDIIASLGRFSTTYLMEQFGLLKKTESMGSLHGTVHVINSTPPSHLVPLYHPAASIYNRNLLETLQKDFVTLSKLVNSLHQES